MTRQRCIRTGPETGEQVNSSPVGFHGFANPMTRMALVALLISASQFIMHATGQRMGVSLSTGAMSMPAEAEQIKGGVEPGPNMYSSQVL